MIATLPPPLSQALATEIEAFSSIEIGRAATLLSLGYRGLAPIPETLSPLERAAYLAVRFPSTFAAVNLVWAEAARAIPLTEMRTLADIGAGPGTASLAAPAHLSATRFERDIGWRDAGDRLARACGRDSKFHHAALGREIKLSRHHIVVASYALSELGPADRDRTIAALWALAEHALIVVEPGTPKGFEIIHAVRAHALQSNGHAAAPCTHDARCPMSTADWCHRPVRVARSTLHRTAKGGNLGHEDEKFAYVVLAREPLERQAQARIVRKPIRNAGHVHLDLCDDAGLNRRTIARSNRAHYRQARDASWGDPWLPYED